MKKLLIILLFFMPLFANASIITIRPEDSKWFYFVLDTKTREVKEYSFVKETQQMRLSATSTFKDIPGGLTFVIGKKVWEFYYCRNKNRAATVPTVGLIDEAIECDFIVEIIEK